VRSVSVIDLDWLGHSRSIASALLRSRDFAALLDPGPSSTLPTLRRELEKNGTPVSELNAIVLTHIHLDHAGATGTLVRENPNLKVYVHARGVPHLLDPTKLLNSASRLWGAELPRLFGEFLPVPAANLQSLEGGETLRLGSYQLEVLYTPGHASHHVTYFDPAEVVAYVGDNAGICINGHPFALPVTPPPDISIELWDASLQAIAALQPKKIFLTHFSYSENPQAHIAAYRERLQLWRDISAEILARNLEDPAAMHAFSQKVAADAAQHLTPGELAHYIFNGALDLSWMGLARYHRKRAEAAAQTSSQGT
jgi:glyoxylase-like metal-dependent hydrolase (beta-lactamase superfamily II)